MKKKFLDSAVKLIKKNNNYSKDEIEIIMYGLETIYLTVTKMIIIVLLAILLGILKEMLLLLISYNIIRSQAFGIHASKSIYCLISSIILFIGGAILCKYLSLNFYLKIVIALWCVGCLYKYAPADTYKRPLINEKKRKRFKLLSVILGCVYVFLILISKDKVISNYLLIGMVEAVMMILPLTYKIFQMPYRNYLTYQVDV